MNFEDLYFLLKDFSYLLYLKEVLTSQHSENKHSKKVEILMTLNLPFKWKLEQTMKIKVIQSKL